MQVTDLPVEVVVIIIKKLDFKSVYSLYQTCPYFSNIICMYNVVKIADLSPSALESVHFLKDNFMKAISRDLQILDLRGIGGLSRSALLTAVRRMKCLNTLDVSYTDITLFDFFEAYKLCPTIKNVACNFVFGEENDVKAHIIQHQHVFQNFDKVHFIGNAANLLYSNLPMLMVHKAHLSQFVLTVVDNGGTMYNSVKEVDGTNVKVHSKFINISVLNQWKVPTLSATSFNLTNIKHMEDKYEFVLITEILDERKVYVSPMMLKFFESYDPNCINPISTFKYSKNGVIMLWDRTQTEFDDIFRQKLKTKMLNFFPPNIVDDTTVATQECDTFCISIPQSETQPVLYKDATYFKKQRQAPQSQTLDYDNVFRNHKRVHLTMSFPTSLNCPVTLSPSSQYLRKLRSLCLTGNVKYSKEFFNVLFSCCEQLETLNVELSRFSPNASFVARNIPLSQSLKNLRLVDKDIDLGVVFSWCSQCSTLENIHLLDLSEEYTHPFRNPSTMIQRCPNLYCINISGPMTNDTKTIATRLLQKLKTEYRRSNLHFELNKGYPIVRYNYDPYCHMFNIHTIKPIELLY